MDDYIDQLLTEMQAPEVLQVVVQNVMDEPIPKAVKKRLLKPLLPGKYRPSPPPHRAKERKRKAILKEFDPVPPRKTFRTIQDYQQDILEVFQEGEKKRLDLVFRSTPWIIGNFLSG